MVKIMFQLPIIPLTKTMQSSVMIFFLAFLMMPPATSGLRRVSETSTEANPFNDNQSQDRTVFYYVAMDLVAKSHFLRANVLSLRNLGQFKGPILFVTDHPECLINNLGTEILGNEPAIKDTDELTVFAGPEKGMSIHIKHLTHNSRFDSKGKIKMGFEEHKALSRVYADTADLPFNRFTLVLIDDDILVARPVDEFLSTISTLSAPLATFHDEGRGREKYHCGMVIVRPHAAECLYSWLTTLTKQFGDISAVKEISDFDSNTNATGRGQQAFSRSQCAKEGRVALLDNERLGFTFPTKSTVQEASAAKTFTHFTNSYRMQKVLKHDDVQNFYNEVFQHDIDIEHGDTSEACTYRTHTYSTYER
eukprot:gnl/MRDRNA2_/MRDRNA2_96390_c0_seq1.p1 gnl/MRDRNA2_/MRDRNA2_96390_c0~~gnl/MRDRNA2_/MRDRNA2_96390_c0_seq1.p1  ORF type:complete len:364 (+),score=43.46 gnl/MRDRNA2_/MRDRNA2_96390_c0_seq1:19-1110(+)